MTPTNSSWLEEQIAQWRQHLRRQRTEEANVEELEGRLREQVALLTGAGLSPDEAFLIAAKRVGRIDGRFRKQLLRALESREAQSDQTRSDAFMALGLAITAAVAIKLPALFGVP